MRPTTLCFLRKGDQILLAMKKRGFGAGKWNGVGGKVNTDEDVKIAAAGEAYEEIGVKVDPNQLEDAGSLKFYFENKQDWDQHMHIFVANAWAGEPAESEEMSPRWYKQGELPFEYMWPDDVYWVPKLISGQKIDGHFIFDEAGEKIINFNLSWRR